MNPRKRAINQSDPAPFRTKGFEKSEMFLIVLKRRAILTLARSQVQKNSFQFVGRVTGIHVSLLSTEKHEIPVRSEERTVGPKRILLLRTCASRLVVPAYRRTGHPFAVRDW